MVGAALNAAQYLKEEGIELEVVNASTIKPLDGFCLSRLAELGRPVFTLEEHVVEGGFGSAVFCSPSLQFVHTARRFCGTSSPPLDLSTI